MKFDLYDVAERSRMSVDEFKKFDLIIGSSNTYSLIRYARKLHNEATLALAKLARFVHGGGEMTAELGEVQNKFELQRSVSNSFLRLAKDAGLAEEIVRPMTKRRALEIVNEL